MMTGRNSTKDVTSKIKCLKCHKEKVASAPNFYENRNPLFDSIKLEICKECILSFIGEENSQGRLDRIYLVLSMLDRPFLLHKWKDCEGKWAKYITQLSSLPQNRRLTFKDSDFGLAANVISNIGDIDPNNDEKIYNAKWMGDYTQVDIEYLENYYAGLDRDFKIVTTNHKDYAKKIAKASLHMDRMFQDMLNGVTGADKKYKDAKEVFDTLSKSAQFSESQRGQNDAGLGCFGVTFDQVEQNKWIPKHTPLDEDAYDKMLKQFSSIKDSV